MQSEEYLYNEDKCFEILRDHITMGLKDTEEGRTLSLEEAFSEIDNTKNDGFRLI